MSYTQLGYLQNRSRRWKEGRDSFRRAEAILAPLVKDFPSIPEYRENLACCRGRLGLSLAWLGADAEAARAYRWSLAEFEKLLPEGGSSPTSIRMYLALTANNLAVLLNTARKRTPGAAAEAVAVAKKAVALSGKDSNYRSTLAVAQFLAGDWRSGLATYLKAIELAVRNGSEFVLKATIYRPSRR
jgi:hypothetical protein